MRSSGGYLLAKCVNPSCSKRFKHVNEGKLLRVDRATVLPSAARRQSASDRRPEFYWLCGMCSGKLNLAFDRISGIVLIPLVNSSVRHLTPSPRGEEQT